MFTQKKLSPLLHFQKGYFLFFKRQHKPFILRHRPPIHRPISVWKVDLKTRGDNLDFIIEGSGFLYKMVRSMVGALLDVGTGKLAPQEIHEILESRKRTEVVVSAPAHGLSLEKVFYRRKV